MKTSILQQLLNMRRRNMEVTLFQTPIVLLIHILNVGAPLNTLTLDQRAFEENASTLRKARREAEVAIRFIFKTLAYMPYARARAKVVHNQAYM